ncbi:MAG TPA: hypothetical protein IGS53_25120 [Leptolyngbyaceae cyanobacterium M33_DOE_097]|uniref:Uncharacterized protein n=1 Tax=Oscillatoriales cyanobacterium SpSt-418 TaxID=2282169 RepID=A0A7C3KJ97_9CYAN|nr:hypothetical protein [Leptolyngbyaceae cyanobacterium M33_DOE_097]
MAYWIKITYDRNTYVIDLDRVATFCHAPNGRVSFTLPDSSITIIVNQQSNAETYQLILDYVEKQTGYSLP